MYVCMYNVDSMFTAFIFPFGFPCGLQITATFSYTYLVCVRRIKLLFPFNESPKVAFYIKTLNPPLPRVPLPQNRRELIITITVYIKYTAVIIYFVYNLSVFFFLFFPSLMKLFNVE